MPLPRSFVGTVEHGQARGHALGFPTANLHVDHLLEGLPLELGVYAGWAQWEGSARERAVINIGSCPTFDQQEVSVEVHLLEFSGNLYGARLKITLIQKLRDEQRFSGAEALIAQIQSDIEQTRAILEKRGGG